LNFTANTQHTLPHLPSFLTFIIKLTSMIFFVAESMTKEMISILTLKIFSLPYSYIATAFSLGFYISNSYATPTLVGCS